MKSIKNLSIRKKLALIVIAFSMVTIVSAGVEYLALDAISLIRAYVDGEGMWSKAQKDSVYHLLKYALYHNPNDYIKYLNLVDVTFGDKTARLELEKAKTDFEISDAGFIKGGNHPDEVRGMGYLFKWFRKVSYIDRAIVLWTEGDTQILRIQTIATALHQKIQRRTITATESRTYFDRISEIQDRLAILETQFSGTLADGGRWLKRILSEITLLFDLLLLGFGILVSKSISDQILESVRNLQAGTAHVRKGDYLNRIPVVSDDEHGQLAESFNAMAESLTIAIEERDRVNMTLMQSSKMASLGEMAGGVAHEINTPLATIKILSEQLQEMADEGQIDNALFRKSVGDIVQTVDRISKIVQGLRSFCRDGSNDGFDTVNVKKMIEDTVSFCSERFKLDGISLTIDDFDPALSFQGRGAQISQVLLNLLNNSHDAILGSLEKWISVSVNERIGNIEICVTDSGKGIEEQVSKKLFQPFFTTKELGKGMGLGLSISLSIVQGHTGSLILDSSCANTRFIIRLPREIRKAA